MADGHERTVPKGTQRITTGCQYCAVGCGYHAFLVPHVPGTGETETLDGVSRFITPAMSGTVRYRGRDYDAAVAPDPRCDLNKGNHSIRGGSQGDNLVSHDGSGRSTQDRLRSPQVRLADGLHEISWATAYEVLAQLVVRATQIQRDGGKLKVGRPGGLGVKIYEYQYLENTFAATKLFYSALGTPNLAYHDRPSAADSSPGMNDAGFRAHDFAYEDLRDADVVFVIGTNPYENQSVFFMQHCVGKELIVLDPRYTPTAQYAVETGGLFLQPRTLGSDALVLQAMAREILERYERAHGAPIPLRLPVGDPATLAGATTPDAQRRAQRVLDLAGFRTFLGVGTADPTYTLANAASVSGIPLERLTEAVDRLFQPLPVPERRPRVAILYEKGVIWGFNYHGTAAIAALGLLLGSYGAPGRLTGRVGGHQKGWAEARVAVETFDRSKPEGYPFRNAHDRYQEQDRPAIQVRHNLDYHLFGPPQALPAGLTLCSAPDVLLLWIIGGNYLGQTSDAEWKRRRLEARLQAGGQGGAVLRPRSTAVEDILEALFARIDAGGVVAIHQEIFANPTTGLCDLVLPAAGWGEETFCRFNAQRRLKLYERFQDPPLHPLDAAALGGHDPWEHRDALRHSAKPDWVIFRDVAHAIGRVMDTPAGGGVFLEAMRRAFPWRSSSEVADALAADSDLGLAGEGPRSMLGDLLAFAESRGIPAGQRVHAVLGLGGRGRAEHLSAGAYSIPGESAVHGNGVATNGVLLPVRAIRDANGAVTGLRGTLRIERPGPFFFVRAGWEEIRGAFERINGRSGDPDEILVTNGRFNHLWNNQFHHLRNDFVSEITPEDLPGTVLELNPAWAGARRIRNGQVVEAAGGGGSFQAIASLQESVPAGGGFALFSYPARDPDPFRGYVNNTTDGYADAINPIGALKYGRAVIKKVPNPKGGGDWIFPEDFPGRVPRLGPSFEQRNRIRPGPAAPPAGVSAPLPADGRLDWEMRELIVTRGLPRARLRRSFVFPRRPGLGEPPHQAHRVSRPGQPDVRAGRFWEIPGLTPQQFLRLRIGAATVGRDLVGILKTGMPAGMLAPGHLETPPDDQARIAEIERLLATRDFGDMELARVRRLLDDLVDRPHRAVADLFFEPDAFLDLLRRDAAVRERFGKRLQPADPRRMRWEETGSLIDEWSGSELRLAQIWLDKQKGGLKVRPTSFKLHIASMFSQDDIDHMRSLGLDLTDYATVKENAAAILGRLKSDDPARLMPPAKSGGPWPAEWIALFQRWIDERFPE